MSSSRLCPGWVIASPRKLGNGSSAGRERPRRTGLLRGVSEQPCFAGDDAESHPGQNRHSARLERTPAKGHCISPRDLCSCAFSLYSSVALLCAVCVTSNSSPTAHCSPYGVGWPGKRHRLLAPRRSRGFCLEWRRGQVLSHLCETDCRRIAPTP